LTEGARPQLDPLLDILGPLVLSFRELPFPTVCALEGPAVGVGMSLALCADLRVVARSASLIPGYLRLGASLDGGLSWSLTAAVGGARAMSIVLRNERLGPDRLMALGLAEEIVDDGEAVSGALALLERLGPIAPLALTRVRSLVDSAAALPLRQQLDRERTLITELWESADYHEGVTAFLEKRAPRFAGN
jgi:enoyl-CoA hydratase/carnithine racemase